MTQYAKLDINDEDGTSSSSPTTIQSNGNHGIDASRNSLIEVDESKPVISGNTNGPIMLGNQSYIKFSRSDTRSISGTINCSAQWAKDPDNSSNNVRVSNYSLLNYSNHIPDQNTRLIISSDCRENY